MQVPIRPRVPRQVAKASRLSKAMCTTRAGNAASLHETNFAPRKSTSGNNDSDGGAVRWDPTGCWRGIGAPAGKPKCTASVPLVCTVTDLAKGANVTVDHLAVLSRPQRAFCLFAELYFSFAIIAFYESKKGSSFSWTPPGGSARKVRIRPGSLTVAQEAPQKFSLSLNLDKVPI